MSKNVKIGFVSYELAANDDNTFVTKTTKKGAITKILTGRTPFLWIDDVDKEKRKSARRVILTAFEELN